MSGLPFSIIYKDIEDKAWNLVVDRNDLPEVENKLQQLGSKVDQDYDPTKRSERDSNVCGGIIA